MGVETDTKLVKVGDGETAWSSLGYYYANNFHSLFRRFADSGNSGAGETDLYSNLIAASQLAANGEKLEAKYGGIFVGHATATRQIRVYFAGTAIFDSTAILIAANASWTVLISIIRVSSSVVRYMITLATQNAPLATYTSVGELTGLTLSGTNILKITGQAAGVGAATNDIVAKLGSIEWVGTT
jgi:hypothetical protein